MHRNGRGSMVDADAARELALFADNDGDLYRMQTTSIIENLAKKSAKGTFDTAKAVKLFGYLADNAAKKYAWEVGNRKYGTRSWHEQAVDGNGLFNAATRREAARMLLESNVEAIEDAARSLLKRNPRRVTNEDSVERYVPVRSVAQGTFVKRKADSKKVYIRRDYDRYSRKVALEDESDMNRYIYLDGDALVYVGFEF